MTGGDGELRRALGAWATDFAAFGVEDLLVPRSEGDAPLEATGAARSVPARPELPPSVSPPSPEAEGGLRRVAEEVAACTRCGLAESRNRVVPGQGHPTARLMFVGEAPGADEDRQGLAFVGRAGQLLTKMIGAMGFGRDEVFIANVLKCRPPGNRDPRPDEVACCLPFLKRQISLIEPEILVALGGSAMKALLGTDASVGRMRKRVHDYDGTPLIITYHPAYLLRSPEMKRAAWEDLQMALGVLGLEPPVQGGRG